MAHGMKCAEAVAGQAALDRSSRINNTSSKTTGMQTMNWQKYEPTLGEILADSGTRALMRADGVKRRDLEILFNEIAGKLAASSFASRCALSPIRNLLRLRRTHEIQTSNDVAPPSPRRRWAAFTSPSRGSRPAHNFGSQTLTCMATKSAGWPRPISLARLRGTHQSPTHNANARWSHRCSEQALP